MTTLTERLEAGNLVEGVARAICKPGCPDVNQEYCANGKCAAWDMHIQEATAVLAHLRPYLVEWNYDMEAAPKGQTNSVIVAIELGQSTPERYVGEAYINEDTGEWWWAGTSAGDYHAVSINEGNHNLPYAWTLRPTPPKKEQQG